MRSAEIEETEQLTRSADVQQASYQIRRQLTTPHSAIHHSLMVSPGMSHGSEFPVVEGQESYVHLATCWRNGTPYQWYLHLVDIGSSYANTFGKYTYKTDDKATNLKVVKLDHSTSIKMTARPLIAISRECGTPWDTSMPNGTTKKKEDASRMSVTSWVIKTGTAIGQSAPASACSKQYITRSNRSKGSLELKKPSHQHARTVRSIYCD
jgi:hypothetical protein